MVTLVATVGFDEKFAIRAIVRHISEVERLVLVTSAPADSRTSKAVGLVKQFLSAYLEGAERRIEVYTPEVDVRYPYEAIALLRREVFERFAGPFVLNLSGGMRALVVVTLASFVLSGAHGVVEIELENFLGTVQIDPKVFYIGRLSESKAGIIREIAKRGRATYKDIAKELRIPRATLFRELKSLRTLGLVGVERDGRSSYYFLTELGRAYQ